MQIKMHGYPSSLFCEFDIRQKREQHSVLFNAVNAFSWRGLELICEIIYFYSFFFFSYILLYSQSGSLYYYYYDRLFKSTFCNLWFGSNFKNIFPRVFEFIVLHSYCLCSCWANQLNNLLRIYLEIIVLKSDTARVN